MTPDLTLDQMGIIVAIVLGLWGAGLSTINTIVQWKGQRRNVRIELGYGALRNVPGAKGSVYILEAINNGALPVTLTDFGLRFPTDPRDKKCNMRFSLIDLATTDRPPPITLESGRKTHTWVDAKNLKESLRQHGFTGIITVQGYFNDQLDNHWRQISTLKIDLGSDPNEK